jgi:hypothetical protein
MQKHGEGSNLGQIGLPSGSPEALEFRADSILPRDPPSDGKIRLVSPSRSL